MKITLHMCSRGRPLQLTAALLSLRDNESGKHDVSYAVAVDVDDKATIGTLVSLQAKIPLGYRVGHRPVSLDALHNQLCRDVPAELYVCFIDDALCLTKGWDDIAAKAYAENPQGLWWWKSKGEELTLAPITSEAWRVAAGGKIFPEHFPYWWGDTWLSAVYVMATESSLKFIDAEILDCPKATHSMRELRFWHNFYLWLQPERAAEARSIAANLGLPEPTIIEPFGKIMGMPNQDFVKRIDEIEASQGDQTEPHEGYRQAKAKAEALMAGSDRPVMDARDFDLNELLTPEIAAIVNRIFPDMVAPKEAA